MYKNFYLGGNQLVIRYENGTHRVFEEYQNYKEVYNGTFEECVKYCEKRYIEHAQDTIG